MKFTRVKPQQPVYEEPFPVHLFVIAVDEDGNELARYDLGTKITEWGQEAVFEGHLRLDP